MIVLGLILCLKRKPAQPYIRFQVPWKKRLDPLAFVRAIKATSVDGVELKLNPTT